MKKITSIFLICIFIVTFDSYSAEVSFKNPRIGIVISKTSFRQRWGVTQMSAHGWAAVAHLAGIPYDCLFLSDIARAKDLSSYDALIFGQCTYVEQSVYSDLLKSIKQYTDKGGNIIIDGPFAVSDEDTEDRDHAALDKILGINYRGFHGNSEYRVRTADNLHYITKNFEKGEYITQHLVNGLNILEAADGGNVLLTTTNESHSYPFLSALKKSINRVVLVSDFSTWAGAASFFRNVKPKVFYKNMLFDIMIRTLHWTVYGDIKKPFPVPQISNANVTAIIRLDADASGNLDAQIKTINYLIDIARESGVVPLYGIVSSSATKAGWQDLAPVCKKIENIGGQIGTHSKYHHIDRKMNEKRWSEELDESKQEIEFYMADFGYSVGDVDHFINPGNTIHMDDYDQIAKRFTFYMTHGFEQDMPLGFGNLTWFTGSYKNLVVLEDTPSPDYQWFYDPSWSYTTQQITAYEEAIFDHMYNNIGRGVIFNEMWHDYSITTQPQRGKERIVNDNNRPFYDAMKAKFATHNIYCPDPVDLGHKLRAMAQWNYKWTAGENKIEIVLDLSQVLLDTIPYYTGGMGLSIENTNKKISEVHINGKEHPAFTDDLIILPNLMKDKNTISVRLADNPCATPRLTYVSKRMPKIEKKDDSIITEVITKSKARIAFYSEDPAVLINADYQEWNRKGANIVRGYVESDRCLELRAMSKKKWILNNTNVTILDLKEKTSSVELTIAATDKPATLYFTCVRNPTLIKLNEQKIKTVKRYNNYNYQINIPTFTDKATLLIRY
ncbi:MAG: hypothetical protein R6V04_00945 [bacterium]